MNTPETVIHNQLTSDNRRKRHETDLSTVSTIHSTQIYHRAIGRRVWENGDTVTQRATGKNTSTCISVFIASYYSHDYRLHCFAISLGKVFSSKKGETRSRERKPSNLNAVLVEETAIQDADLSAQLLSKEYPQHGGHATDLGPVCQILRELDVMRKMW
ncbi:hypothetical protein AVEN_58767-1 [Araneus ventricosus]|uniref:Uncharacterized protein n=1 Tax=Araneus ventricosus TaxID=182803 RepID=A0A4Y2VUL8_ARAVE|nr:hypothetical protein AVEN_58767-1 [Araneus ventricosus]